MFELEHLQAKHESHLAAVLLNHDRTSGVLLSASSSPQPPDAVSCTAASTAFAPLLRGDCSMPVPRNAPNTVSILSCHMCLLVATPEGPVPINEKVGWSVMFASLFL